MKKGGIGGANTKTGLAFEIQTDFPTFLASQDGYSIDNIDYDTKRTKRGGKTKIIKGTKLRSKPFRWSIKFLGDEVGQIFQKAGLYRYFDEIDGFDYTKIISAQLLPDEAIFVVSKNTVYIVKKKTQSGGGSVDEKLQTCDFKLKQYKKLFSPLNKEVCYSYLLDKDWFKNPRYKDTLDYIISVGCKYYFNYIPLDAIGLPLPKQEEN